jgi:hypothetical protein
LRLFQRSVAVQQGANVIRFLGRAQTRELIAAWKPDGRFILNAGCAIPPSTPEENIRALMETVREEGQYAAPPERR